jgi:phage internal scaffolding protein
MNFTKKQREKREKDTSPITNWGDSLTKTEYKDEVDVNKIVQKARRGEFVSGSVRSGFYEDVTSMPESYQDSLMKIKEVKKEFEQIPSDIRKRFSNNPEELAKWVMDPQNAEEALKLGLLEKEEEPKPQKVEVINQPKTSEKPSE